MSNEIRVAVSSEEDFEFLARLVSLNGYKLQSLSGDGDYRLVEVEQ